jgi:hypothetical protein
MLWLLLFAFVALAIFINSFRLLFLTLIVLLIRVCPLATLSSICAVIAWAVKTNLRR